MITATFTVDLENDVLLNGVDFVVFLSKHQDQDIVLIINNEGHCCTHNGIYNILDNFKFRSVTIKTSNALETHDQYVIDNRAWAFWLEHTTGFDLEFDYEWDQTKVFGCIFGRPSAPRLGIAAHLSKYYHDRSLILTKFDLESIDSRKLFDLQRLFAWNPGSVQDYMDMPKIPNSNKYIKGQYQWDNAIIYHYKSFMIDIISEPVCEGRSFYPTEKLSRSILCRRPFIVMASKNYLDYLHQMGFYTFSEFWEESYDGYDGVDRYKQILNLIDSIGQKSKKELVDIYYSAKFFLDHNFELLKEKKFNKEIIPYHEYPN